MSADNLVVVVSGIEAVVLEWNCNVPLALLPAHNPITESTGP